MNNFNIRYKMLIVLQVNLYTLLTKFDGNAGKEYKTYRDSHLKRFKLKKLPAFLILYHKVRMDFLID